MLVSSMAASAAKATVELEPPLSCPPERDPA